MTVHHARAQRELIAVMIGEFSHERLLAPVLLGATARGERHHLTAPDGATRYEFTARRHPMEHWQVDSDSLLVLRDGRNHEPDVHRFVSEFVEELAIGAEALERHRTIFAHVLDAVARRYAEPQPSAIELVDASTVEVEAAVEVGGADMYFRSRGRPRPAAGVRTGHWLTDLANGRAGLEPTRLTAGDGERLVPLAALLHRDADGHSFLAATVEASGISAHEWVREWLHVHVRPLVHLLVARDVVLTPAEEDVTLALVDHVPARVFVRTADREAPGVLGAPVDEQSVAIHAGVFDGLLRHVATILDTDDLLDAEEFWALVRECITLHVGDHPDLARAHRRHDLTRARFVHVCPERSYRHSDQAPLLRTVSFATAGTLANPVAPPPPVPTSRRGGRPTRRGITLQEYEARRG